MCARILLNAVSNEKVKKVSRSWGIDIQTPLEGQSTFCFFREIAHYLGNETLSSKRTNNINVSADYLADKEVTLDDDTVITGAQLLEALAKFGDLTEINREVAIKAALDAAAAEAAAKAAAQPPTG